MEHLIISRADAKASGRSHYFTGKPCKRGGIAARRTLDGACSCDACRARKHEYMAGYYPKWISENRSRIDEYQSAYRAENSARRVAYNSVWNKSNAEVSRLHKKSYRDRNPDMGAAQAAKRRARLARATPAWLTPADLASIQLIYKRRQQLTLTTGIEHHVDHIIPLRGDLVCGLHVPENLRVVPAAENLLKSNAFNT